MSPEKRAALLRRELRGIARSLRRLGQVARLLRERVAAGDLALVERYQLVERERGRWLRLQERATLAACLAADDVRRRERKVLPC